MAVKIKEQEIKDKKRFVLAIAHKTFGEANSEYVNDCVYKAIELTLDALAEDSDEMFASLVDYDELITEQQEQS